MGRQKQTFLGHSFIILFYDEMILIVKCPFLSSNHNDSIQWLEADIGAVTVTFSYTNPNLALWQVLAVYPDVYMKPLLFTFHLLPLGVYGCSTIKI